MTDHAETKEALHLELQTLLEADKSGANGTQTVTLDQQSVGRLSRMDALQNQAMSLANARLRTARTARIHAALQRLQDNDFGYCLECGEPIEPARIAADPTVPTCMDCLRG